MSYHNQHPLWVRELLQSTRCQRTLLLMFVGAIIGSGIVAIVMEW
jgi:hypothetical protein